MNKLIVSALLLLSLGAQASFTNSSTDCAPNYRPTAADLAAEVDTLEDNYVTLGYFISGEFMSFRVQGCQNLAYSQSRILCNGQVIGALAPLKLPSYGAPNARLALSQAVRAELVGSCNPAKRSPLTLVIR